MSNLKLTALAAVGLLAAPFVASAQDCTAVANQVTAAVSSNPSEVVSVVSNAVAANPACAGAIVRAAIIASNADDATVGQIVYAAVSAAPDQAAAIADAAISVSPKNSALTIQAAVRDALSTDVGDDDYLVLPVDVRGVYLVYPVSGTGRPDLGEREVVVVERVVVQRRGGGVHVITVPGGTPQTPN